MDVQTCFILGAVCTLAALLLWYCVARPKVRRGETTNQFLIFLDNFFGFRKLYIEAVLRFLYTLCTIACVCIGFWMMFGKVQGFFSSSSTFGAGLALMILGPIGLRLSYELLMMTVMLVQNVLEINKKLQNPTSVSKSAPAPQPAPAPQQAPAPQPTPAPQELNYRFCTACGTRYDANTTDTCPNCGKKQ